MESIFSIEFFILRFQTALLLLY